MLRTVPLTVVCALWVAAGCTGTPPADTADTGSDVLDWSYPLDDVLRVSHGQILGTHNSYHIAPDPALVEEWEYTHQPLDVQAGELGVRQFELDAWYNEDTEGVDVYHAPIVDDQTTCGTLVGCLEVLRVWSERNPAHFPLIVLIEPKDELSSLAMTERPDELDEAVLAGWPRDAMWTPDDQLGAHATLRESVLSDGWPLLGELRGKAIFVLLDSGDGREAYTAGQTTVADRPLFPLVDVDHDLAAFFLMDDPEGSAESIGEAVDAGFLVRTRADAGGAPEDGSTARLEAAVASGAHCLSTDYPEVHEETGYQAAVPGGLPVGCNPRTAPDECVAEALEDPQWMR